MENPWFHLPDSPPYILQTDAETIQQFNTTANERTRIATDLLPEPFVGRLDAPIFMLLLNPGLSDDDFAVHRDTDFVAAVRSCHRQRETDYPNYYLAPTAAGPGGRWTQRVLKPLIAEFGLRAVSQNVTQLEYFPYHSVGFAHHGLRVPSQAFGFHVMRAAIQRDAVIFVTRGLKIWETAVPDLATYRRAFRTRSVQNVVISPRNCPDGYHQAQTILRNEDAPLSLVTR
jgi:hypothetical protein